MNGPALHKRTATTTKEPRGCHRKVRLRRPHTNYNSRETLRHGLRGLHFPEGLSAPELICRLNLDERHSLLGNVVLEPETILPGPVQLIVPGLLSKYFGYICACVNVWVCSCACLFVREACWAAACVFNWGFSGGRCPGIWNCPLSVSVSSGGGRWGLACIYLCRKGSGPRPFWR